MQTAAIYARVSTDWQAEHRYSLDTLKQKKNIVHAIIESVIYERVDETHKNGKYDIRFLIHFA